jgi:HlyD family secretion protein
MRNKIIFGLVVVGVLIAVLSAYVYAVPAKPQPPVFNPAPNPFVQGIYANGIIESYQSQGENVNIYPEVPGTIARILVIEGQSVEKGTPLFQIDDSIQRATTEQQRAQAEAASALLDELKAQPRKENLEVARAQVDMATASLKSANDTLSKQQHSYDIAPESISRDQLDNAINASKVAKANLDVVTRQFELTKAGAWVYDIRNQERQLDALSKAYSASSALLSKYTVKAPIDGIVLSIQSSQGSYVSPQGAYDPYTQGFDPVVMMGASKGTLNVRVYVDEILIPRLPPVDKIRADMFIRGTNTKIPLEFLRLQPYVSPKIELSNQRQEKVDVRVLPVIFRFSPPPGIEVYPGELVDVYIGKDAAR